MYVPPFEMLRRTPPSSCQQEPPRNDGSASKLQGRRRREDVVVRAATVKKVLAAARTAVQDEGEAAAAAAAAAPAEAVAVEEVPDGGKPLSDPDLAGILRRCNHNGEALLQCCVHATDIYSDGPEALAEVHQPALRATRYGNQEAWLFYGSPPPANCAGNRHERKVGGEQAGSFHSEGAKEPILGVDGKSILGYKHRFSYMISNPAGGRRLRHGWIMFEISLHEEDGADQKVLCMLCKSNRKYPKSSSATSSTAAETSSVEEVGASVDEFRDLSGGDTSPAPVPAALIPALSTSPVGRSQPLFRCSAAANDNTMAAVGNEVREGEKAASGLVVMAIDDPSGEQFKEMAENILIGLDQRPVVVLCASGRTLTNIYVQAAEKAAVSCNAQNVSKISELQDIKKLYRRTASDLGLKSSIVSGLLKLLEYHLRFVALTKKLTPTTRDYLASFGERMYATIFCAYLEAHGKKTHQIWKDGVLMSEPNICTNAIPVTYLTFDEATELACSGAQALNPPSTRLAMEGCIPVIIVKNSYNPQAPGTRITQARDTCKIILSSIVLRKNLVMLDIVSTGAASQLNFLAQVSQLFKDAGIRVDLQANGGGKIYLTLHPSKQCGREHSQQEIANVLEKVKQIAVVQEERISIISLLGNVHEWTFIIAKVVSAVQEIGVVYQDLSWKLSKVIEVSLVVRDCVAIDCVRALHTAFFEKCIVSEALRAQNESSILVNSSQESSSGEKRKSDDDCRMRNLRRKDTDRSSIVEETTRTAFSDKGGNPTEFLEDDGRNLDCVMDAGVVQPEQRLSVDDYEVYNVFGIEVADSNGGVPEVQPNEVGEGSSVPEAAQPEKQVLAELREGGSGALGVVEDVTERSHHPMTDDWDLEDLRLRMRAEDDPQTSVAEYYANAFHVDNDDKGFEIEVDYFNGGVPQVKPEQGRAVSKVGKSCSVPEAVQPEQQVINEVREVGSGAACVPEDVTERTILADDDYQTSFVMRRQRAETEPQLSSNNGGDAHRGLNDFYDSIEQTDIPPANVDNGTGLAEEANHIMELEHGLFLDDNLTYVGGEPDQQVPDEVEDGIEALLAKFCSPDELIGPLGRDI